MTPLFFNLKFANILDVVLKSKELSKESRGFWLDLSSEARGQGS